jgi:hypothetical protein
MSIDETPTPDALDAAVDRQYNELRDMIGCGDSYTDQRVVEATITDLVTAVEARAVARAERVCEWRIRHDHWALGCQPERRNVFERHDYCGYCGGRVRVVEG